MSEAGDLSPEMALVNSVVKEMSQHPALQTKNKVTWRGKVSCQCCQKRVVGQTVVNGRSASHIGARGLLTCVDAQVLKLLCWNDRVVKNHLKGVDWFFGISGSCGSSGSGRQVWGQWLEHVG